MSRFAFLLHVSEAYIVSYLLICTIFGCYIRTQSWQCGRHLGAHDDCRQASQFEDLGIFHLLANHLVLT
jgi:hypothetical protein